MYNVFLYNARKAVKIIQSQGVLQGSKTVLSKIKKKNEIAILKKDVFKFYNYLLLGSREAKLTYQPKDELKLSWFIPDFGIGSGGHLNIFRIIHLLEKISVKSDIYICGASQWGNPSSVKEIIDKNFFPLESNVYIIEDNTDIKNEYDIAIATSWQTAYYVRAFENCVKKVYFVQDFEPYFYPQGSAYSFAEQTYKFGFYGITAGDWLKEKLSAEYGMECESFSFSYEKDLYKPHGKRDKDIQRVFFYSRPPTDRRGFELGIMVLNEFCKKNPHVEVVMAGWDVSEYEIPFKHFNAGVVRIEELSHLYSQCDVSLILSFTNLSLLPLELMASGCPVVINQGRNNDWIDPHKELFIYVENDIAGIAEVLDQVINKKINTQLMLENAADLLQNSSWEKEAQHIKNYIYKILGD
ncbi:rhamnosyltransferase WsaF family glycosyltransferase [Paenibacillus jiagnxiensis]|uniref:rhamnosyltransferase WsaF family glycosyltransferase n=1 Tax=Paenibacillus jiagnxiensis TaxID=3228926 RepID=UPI00339EDF28